MTDRSRDVLLWAPRILGIAMGLFLALFALDAGSLLALPIHLLPALAVLAVVAAAWRRPWVGAVAFLAFAAIYAASVARRPDWVLAIAAPRAVVGVLYALGGRRARPAGPPDGAA